MLRHFGWSGLFTLATVVATVFLSGFSDAVSVLILIAIEIAFSFDNAIINAKILERLSHVWQQLFLTIGMVIAILGMRLLFPILIVMVTADLGWHQVIDDALHHPHAYAQHLAAAHTAISAFGGGFLLTLCLYFLFDDARETVWLASIERPLQRWGGNAIMPPLVGGLIVLLIALIGAHERLEVLRAGLVGVIAYTAITLGVAGLGKLAGNDETSGQLKGWGAFVAFIYLQILDASFSFDGVLGAFAITSKIVLIAVGLGVGALWVRSLTVYMVRQGSLQHYRYLEHGAHYAILSLVVALFCGIYADVPDVITGIVGLGIIGASLQSSREALKATRKSASGKTKL